MKTNKILMENLGMNGRMISPSKSGYRSRNPKSIAVFNANLIISTDKGFEKIWYGDIDITKDEVAIRKIALALGTMVWVLPEMAARFDNENDPDIGQYVFMTDGKDYEIGTKYYHRDSIERNEEGLLTLKK